jgi:hypothetical protein
MYLTLLIIHNSFRWIALGCLIYSTSRAFDGYLTRKTFSNTDNAFRHWTATILQIQMMIGFVLYFNSPESSFKNIHLSLMFIAVTILSIGSAIAKRKSTDREKFKTMLTWFLVALLIILISIPWPFSPLAQRPYFRFS